MGKPGGVDFTFFGHRLEGETELFLKALNPWWTGDKMRLLPSFKRWIFSKSLNSLKDGLAPITVIRGPRQVGKTTLQEQLIDHLINIENVDPIRIFRVQFDEIPAITKLKQPILGLSGWYEKNILKMSFNEAAHQNRIVYLFFDEVQNLNDWAPQLKTLVDHNSIKVVVTGSSALRIELGRDSLAGRISTLELGTLQLREIAPLRGWGEIPPVSENLNELIRADFWKHLKEHGRSNHIIRDMAFEAFSNNGGYPIAQKRADAPWNEIADQLNETIIKRVIQHDLRIGDRGRKRDQNLLEELFRLSCRYAGQAPGQAFYIAELKSALRANIGWSRVNTYLKFLNDTLLIRLVQPLELRLKRQKGQPKLCLCDHSLRASWLQEIVPLTETKLQEHVHLHDLAGRIAESIAGYFLSGIPNLDIAWFPQKSTEPEVDYVITVGEYRIPIEIKYRGRIDFGDTLGLRAFLEKSVYNAPFGIMVTLNDAVDSVDPRIICLPLSTLLIMR